MRLKICLAFTLLALCTIISSLEVYQNEWSIEILGGESAAKRLALENGFLNFGEIIPGSNLYHMKYPRRSKRSVSVDRILKEKLANNTVVTSAKQLVEHIRVKRDPFYSRRSLRLNDPYWDRMWYLNRGENLDMNVQGAWDLGMTGKGVAVSILDDGIERDHPDLAANYDSESSTDINDNDADPQPRYDLSNSNRHGTRCAGQVAASPNNSLCAVGIAYNAKIGGIRMLDGQVNDAVEARSFSFNPDHIDIYSSSWGPNDDGKTVDGPGQLTLQVFENGVKKGRNGKGSIFVLASGNGGRFQDNCNCDGYAISIYTISVSSTSESGSVPWYSESCPSTLATTYSSGTSRERQVVTTDLHHQCTMKHTGTSASAPMAAGIVALTLEANPSLTWRDVQHIIVRTARPENLRSSDWKMNGAMRQVSHSYGFGLMDATAMVKLAQKWNLVPAQEKCVVSSSTSYKMIPAQESIVVDLIVDDCSVKVLEHVVVPIRVSPGFRRGDLKIVLTSPSGTRSVLLDKRPKDFSTQGFIDWPFMTVHNWGENPKGVWKLQIFNEAIATWSLDAKFYKWSLILYGTTQDVNSDDVLQQSDVPSDSSEKIYDKDVSPGCISKSDKICTNDSSVCLTLDHYSMANIICKCDKKCDHVFSTSDGSYQLKCDRKINSDTANDKREVPVYCQFLPFIGY